MSKISKYKEVKYLVVYSYIDIDEKIRISEEHISLSNPPSNLYSEEIFDNIKTHVKNIERLYENFRGKKLKRDLIIISLTVLDKLEKNEQEYLKELEDEKQKILDKIFIQKHDKKISAEQGLKKINDKYDKKIKELEVELDEIIREQHPSQDINVQNDVKRAEDNNNLSVPQAFAIGIIIGLILAAIVLFI